MYSRSALAKNIRRLHGDRGGFCHFGLLLWQPRKDGISNTLSGVQKDNLLLIEYEL